MVSGIRPSGPNAGTMARTPCARRSSGHRVDYRMPSADLVGRDLARAVLGLPAGLAEIDELLDDPRFFEPFRPFFDPRGVDRRSRWSGS